MGGGYAPDLTNRTDYLVASEVGSEKYFVACQRSIPIVRAEWLLACWKEAALLSPHVRHSGFKLCVEFATPDHPPRRTFCSRPSRVSPSA